MSVESRNDNIALSAALDAYAPAKVAERAAVAGVAKATLPLVPWKWLPHSERGIKPNIGRKSPLTTESPGRALPSFSSCAVEQPVALTVIS